MISRLPFSACVAALACGLVSAAAQGSVSAPGPITTPISAIKFYQQSVNRGLCAQAYKLIALGQPRTTWQSFRNHCSATKHLAMDPIVDPGYRIQRLNAVYTCLGVRFTASFRDGTVQSSGGWYLMEKTPYVFWHILLSRSHIAPNAPAAAPVQATCTAAIPPYAQPSSALLIIGSDFLSSSTGWIAVSRSGAYVPNGSCTHGIGTNCNTAQTSIYGTDDAGIHWRKLLSLTTSAGPLVWIRIFSANTGLVGVDVGTNVHGMLYRTSNGGMTWRHWSLPAGYFPDDPTITFPDPLHGWVYIGGGAAGSMNVTVFSTDDGGKRWSQVACTIVQVASAACRSNSGIPFGGDKEFLAFVNARSGWLTIVSASGVPTLLHSSDGGRTWHDQHLGLPPGVPLPGPHATVFPMGTFDAPHLFGQVGLLAENVSFYRARPQASWSHLYLYRSTDAGTTWPFYQRVPLPAPTATQYEPGNVPVPMFVDERHWFVTLMDAIWSTANAGKTWSHAAMHIPQGLQFMSLKFPDSSHGWAEAMPRGGTGGMLGGTALLRTSDGGRDWSRIAVPTLMILDPVHGSSPGHTYAPLGRRGRGMRGDAVHGGTDDGPETRRRPTTVCSPAVP